MTPEIIGSILGGAGFAGLIAWVLIRFLIGFISKQQVTIENHIHHNTAAVSEMTGAIRELTNYLKDRDRFRAGRD